MPRSNMRDILGNDLRPGDRIVYIVPGVVKGLIIGRVTLMHMNSVVVERVHPRPAPDAQGFGERYDELMIDQHIVRPERT
jgi:hypothetical protein